MPVNFTDGTFRAVDTNGDPLDGGKLYTYQAGSLTPATTWTSFAKSQPNTNPVIMDESGRARVWLDGSTAYRMILRTAGDVTVWDVDNIEAQSVATLIASLASSASASVGAGMVGYDATRDYLPGTVGAAIKEALATVSTVIDPHLAPWFADNTGTEDVTDEFNAAYAVARATGAFVTPSPGSYLFNGSLDPAGTTTWGPGVFHREQTVYDVPSVVFLHNGSDPLIDPSAPGWNMHGITFYDPNQDGSGIAPVARPALIKPTTTARLIDITIDHCIVVNAYRFLEVPVGSLAGDIRIHHNRIYAIQFGLLFNEDAPEAIFLDNNIWSHGIYQTIAKDFNGGMLANWTAKNGTVIAVDCLGDSVDGLKSTNSLYFGYRYAIDVANGRLDLASFSGDTFDGCATVLRCYNAGGVVGCTFTGGSVTSYTFGDATVATNAFQYSTSGTVDVDLGNLKLVTCSRSWVIDDGSGVSTHAHSGQVGPYGRATGLTGDVYAFGSTNSTSTWNIKSVQVKSDYADSIGVYMDECTSCLVTGTYFAALKTPVVLTANLVAGAIVNLTGCVSQFTLGAKSVSSAAPAGPPVIAFEVGCRWDEPSDITPSV